MSNIDPFCFRFKNVKSVINFFIVLIIRWNPLRICLYQTQVYLGIQNNTCAKNVSEISILTIKVQCERVFVLETEKLEVVKGTLISETIPVILILSFDLCSPSAICWTYYPHFTLCMSFLEDSHYPPSQNILSEKCLTLCQ